MLEEPASPAKAAAPALAVPGRRPSAQRTSALGEAAAPCLQGVSRAAAWSPLQRPKAVGSLLEQLATFNEYINIHICVAHLGAVCCPSFVETRIAYVWPESTFCLQFLALVWGVSQAMCWCQMGLFGVQIPLRGEFLWSLVQGSVGPHQ